MNISAIDESDSSDGDDLQGENELSEEEENDEDDDEDDEDIPISDLEDLSDGEKEDLIPHQRLTINNTAALTSALKRISLPLSSLPFSAHQSLTSSEPIKIADVSDDLNRELAFYAQSLEAVKEGRKLLKQEGVPFTRPTDYFAEMVKADEHMEKVKRKLVEEAANKKASAEARKQRDLKKFGKQVQVAKLQEREKEKRETLEKIKSLKRSEFPVHVLCGGLCETKKGIVECFANAVNVQSAELQTSRARMSPICSTSHSTPTMTRLRRRESPNPPAKQMAAVTQSVRRRMLSSDMVARSASLRVVMRCPAQI